MRCREAVALVLAVATLVGCGGEGGGKATIWITRDRGTHVLLQKSVPSGLTAMQALDRVADIDTRYSGRFVQAINGVEGSLGAQRDWFYFINGYEGDRSAAEYRLHAGDVEWWDFRSWRNQMRVPLVVGAFPEPFLHGYGGKTLPARVVYLQPDQRADAERLARLVGGRAIGTFPQRPNARMNVLVLEADGSGDRPSFRVAAGSGPSPGDPVLFRFRGDSDLLLRRPPFGRFRYEVHG
ncbi:MAG TPA: DUF4430 domain-containing protein [Gaiellaceae bacterium]